MNFDNFSDREGPDAAPSAGIPIPDPVLAAVQATINALMKLDPEGAARLSEIQGRVLMVELSGFGSRIYLLPGPDHLLLFGDYDAEPDCVLRGSPVALLHMLTAPHREDDVFSGAIEISGDNHLAQVLGEVLRGLDIDWEEQLAKVLGDPVAHQLGEQTRAAAGWTRRSASSLFEDLGEYLREEGRLAPSREEVREFMDAVDQTRDDVERLAARIERLGKSSSR